jgi:hypothetical protein
MYSILGFNYAQLFMELVLYTIGSVMKPMLAAYLVIPSSSILEAHSYAPWYAFERCLGTSAFDRVVTFLGKIDAPIKLAD